MGDSVRDAWLGEPCGPLLVNYAKCGENCARSGHSRVAPAQRRRQMPLQRRPGRSSTSVRVEAMYSVGDPNALMLTDEAPEATHVVANI